ncbi:MAG: phosphoadenosine phosphosulfate reductase family protein [Candidatus Hydrothermarchaeales archaeon]
MVVELKVIAGDRMDEALMNLSLEEKVEKSKEVITEGLEKYGDNSIIAYTGGKDSTLMLWMIRDVCKERGVEVPELMFINEGHVFEEVVSFVYEIAEKWGLKFTEVKNEDVLRQAKEVGDIVYVDRLDEVNRAELAKLGFTEKSFPFEPESYVGNHLMKTVAMNNFLSSRNVEAVFTGIRWDEQEARRDETYFSPRDEPMHVRVHPILHFTEREVWDALKKHDIPTASLYAKGYRSLGAKGTTTKTSDLPAWEQDLENTVERAGRRQDKEGIMKRLRDLGYM